jgi:hypothetical protein
MVLWLSLILAATIRDGGAWLRTGCDAGAPPVAELAGGTEVSIRFSISGGAEPCYRVSAPGAEGYLPASALVALDSFESARRSGQVLRTGEALTAVRPAALTTGPRTLAGDAAHWIELSQPSRALALLEPEIRKPAPDPGLLALAGAAAWRADDSRRALELWKRSLAMRPDPGLQALYERVERETQADGSSQRIYGARVLLRYEGAAVPVETAREMAAVVEQEFARISAQLGCSTSERIVTIVQSREAYRKATAAAEWSAGLYDGRIRVPVFGSGPLDRDTRRTLAHEVTHACLSMLGRWPAWLQEGVAQHMSGARLGPAERQQLEHWIRAGKLPSLAKLGEDWSGMDGETARAAYALALRAIEVFEQEFSAYGLRNLLRNPERLPQITAELDRRLGL